MDLFAGAAFGILALLLLISAACFVFWVWSIVDVVKRPDGQWDAAGQSKVLWLVLIVGGGLLFGLGFFASLLYVLIARPSLKRAEAGSLGYGNATPAYAGSTYGAATPRSYTGSHTGSSAGTRPADSGTAAYTAASWPVADTTSNDDMFKKDTGSGSGSDIGGGTLVADPSERDSGSSHSSSYGSGSSHSSSYDSGSHGYSSPSHSSYDSGSSSSYDSGSSGGSDFGGSY